MKVPKFSEAQIVFVLKQAEDGAPVADVPQSRDQRRGILQLAQKYAGLMPSEMKRLRQLEDENAKLKRIVADLASIVSTESWVCNCITKRPSGT